MKRVVERKPAWLPKTQWLAMPERKFEQRAFAKTRSEKINDHLTWLGRTTFELHGGAGVTG